MNQIVKNIKSLLEKYPTQLDSENKLVLMYLKEYQSLRFDGKHISTTDFLNIDMNLVQAIVDAKYILDLLEEDSK